MEKLLNLTRIISKFNNVTFQNSKCHKNFDAKFQEGGFLNIILQVV